MWWCISPLFPHRLLEIIQEFHHSAALWNHKCSRFCHYLIEFYHIIDSHYWNPANTHTYWQIKLRIIIIYGGHISRDRQLYCECCLSNFPRAKEDLHNFDLIPVYHTRFIRDWPKESGIALYRWNRYWTIHWFMELRIENWELISEIQWIFDYVIELSYGHRRNFHMFVVKMVQLPLFTVYLTGSPFMFVLSCLFYSWIFRFHSVRIYWTSSFDLFTSTVAKIQLSCDTHIPISQTEDIEWLSSNSFRKEPTFATDFSSFH